MSNILLKRSGGTDGYHLFYSPKQGLCCQQVREHRLETKEILIEHIRPDFDAVIDAKDNIHIVCQDKKKNILYFFYHQEKWEKRIVLQAKEGAEVYAGQFRLFYRNGYLRMMYVMEHKGKKLLCSHELYEENTQPQVLDVLDDEYSFYTVTQNQAADTVLCYYSKEKQALGTQTYLWSQKKWGGFEIIDERISPPADLQIYADSRDTLHLCYKCKNFLYYRRREFRFEQSGWSEEKVIARQQSNFPVHPAFFSINQRLWICWTVGMALVGTPIPTGGEEWEKAQELSNTRRAKGILFLLNSASSQTALSFPHYGFILNNQIKLAGILDYFTAEKKQTVHMDGIDIPVREITQSGSDIEEYAAQNSYGGSGSYIPGSREDIEKEKQRIKELLTGQPADGSVSVSQTEKTSQNTSSGNDFDDFSAEYFYELLRQDEMKNVSAVSNPPDLKVQQSSDTVSASPTADVSAAPLRRTHNNDASVAEALSQLAAALEDLSAALQFLKIPKRSRAISNLKNRKLAKVHNKIK